MLKLTSIQLQTNNIKLSYNYTFCHLHAVTWHHAKIVHAVQFGTNYFQKFTDFIYPNWLWLEPFCGFFAKSCVGRIIKLSELHLTGLSSLYFLYAVTWHLSEFSKLLQYCCVTSRVFPGFAPVLSFSNSLRILKVFCSCVGLAERYVSPFDVDVLCQSAHSEVDCILKP